MSRKVRCLPSLLRPRPHRRECRAAACPSRAHFSIFRGQHFGLILFFHPARGNDERRNPAALRSFPPCFGSRKTIQKSFAPPVFPGTTDGSVGLPATRTPPVSPSSAPGAATLQRAGAALPCGKAAPDHVAVVEVYSRPILRAMLWAARRPAPMARMTVAAPVTMSPPAYTLGMEVSPFSSTAM